MVYNLGGGADGANEADAYWGTNIARVTGVDYASPNNPVITMANNPFAAQATPLRSPSDRFQVVTGPVSYVCEPLAGGGSALVRYWDYPIGAGQGAPPQGRAQRAVIAARVADCSQVFRYGSEATRRSALVILNLALRAGTDRDALVRLVSQVHVDNTP